MKSRVWIWTTSLALLLAVAGAAGAQSPPPAPLRKINADAPKQELTLEVAATFEQREYGLMNRTSLEPHTGMIFVFPQEIDVDFWMKNTLIPLDMVFIGRTGRVTSVATNVPSTTPSTPDDQIPRRHGRAKFVLELSAGEAAGDGLKSGAFIRLPPLSAKE
jgi:uncharacterized membrane protein (UPF0127 family)